MIPFPTALAVWLAFVLGMLVGLGLPWLLRVDRTDVPDVTSVPDVWE